MSERAIRGVWGRKGRGRGRKGRSRRGKKIGYEWLVRGMWRESKNGGEREKR